jgi:hypothetical protein
MDGLKKASISSSGIWCIHQHLYRALGHANQNTALRIFFLDSGGLSSFMQTAWVYKEKDG